MDIGPAAHDNATVVSITTYERDSIWHVNGLALITSAAIERSSRKIFFRGRNYRYESAPRGQVLHLLEHPMGTIPISRINLPNAEMPGANLADLIAGFHTIFRVRERHSGVTSLPFENAKQKPTGGPTTASENGSYTSELTVFDDGQIEYRYAPGCVHDTEAAELPTSHIAAQSWNWRATCPGSQAAEKIVTFTLKPDDLAQLEQLLDRKEVKDVQGYFCNATSGVGDFDIEIPRGDSTQEIPVFGLMPEHFELREHPAITYLLCRAKLISQQATNLALPAWCSDLPPLK